MKLVIRGGIVIDPAAGLSEPRDLLIDKGKIEALVKPGARVAGAKTIVAEGCWVVPGLIDMHVHLREPGEEYKETIASGTAAALAGGLTALACMANTRPVNDNASVCDYILEQAREAKKARVYPVGAVSRGLTGEGLAEIGELAARGCVAVSDDGRPVSSPGLLRRALEYCLSLDLPLLSHCEELALSAGGVMHEGEVSTELGLPGIPAAAEEVMAARDIILAEMTGARLHLQHLSTAGAVRLLREAKARGVQVTGETCPHYFSLTHEAVRGYDPNFRMNPPLRTEEDRKAVIEGLRDGTIDVIASDHAPHSPVEKDLEFELAANGIVGLETMLPLALELTHQKKLAPERLIELISVNPARILGVPGGSLKPGAPADITVIDPELNWTVDRDKFFSKSKNTPFHGRRVRGRAVTVIVDGKVARP